jgi:3-oxoacyl-[acyl-carrier protein] reductase
MNLDLKGHFALVGGGSKGIGFAVAKELSLLGATCTLLSRDPDSLADACKSLPKPFDQDHDFLSVDFQNPEKLAESISILAKKRDYTIIINNTGGPPPGPAHSSNLSDYLDAFRMHLLSYQAILTEILPGMQKIGFGRIINIISTSVKQPLDGLGVSNTIRGAVASWAKTLANELGKDGITVNNVLPGATATERLEAIFKRESINKGISLLDVENKHKEAIPLRRFANAEEIASAVAFLASPAASYVTGINFPVDGGRTKSL